MTLNKEGLEAATETWIALLPDRIPSVISPKEKTAQIIRAYLTHTPAQVAADEAEREITLNVKSKLRVAFRKALADLPEIAPPEIASVLSSVHMQDIFLSEGKRLQREHGTDAVAPRVEQECGAGAWSFMRQGVLSALSPAPAAQVTDEMVEAARMAGYERNAHVYGHIVRSMLEAALQAPPAQGEAEPVAKVFYEGDDRSGFWAEWEDLDEDDPTRRRFLAIAEKALGAPHPTSLSVAVEALEAARAEFLEAEDKFHVIHCNHPGKVAGQAQEEDKQFCATMSDRMRKAGNAVRTALATIKEGNEDG